MNISITKQFKFEAAHSIPQHEGKCKRLHGHSYILEVTVSGPVIDKGPKEGMVMDFGDISKIVDVQVIDQWDHQFLNDMVPFVTTAENLASECFKRLISAGLPVTRIKLWETTKCFVEVSA